MIDNKLLKEIEEYCKLNDITDTESLINKMLINGFNIEKHGNKPLFLKEPTIKVKDEIVIPNISDNKEELNDKSVKRYNINIKTKINENNNIDYDDYDPKKKINK